MAKYLDQNGLLYFWQKIVSKFVAKESGKGLSTNDYTTEEKNKLAGLNNYTLPTASAETLGGVKVGSGLTISDGVLNATGGGTADSVDWSNIQNKPDVYAKTETYSKTEVDSKLSAVYKPGGSVLFSELPTPNATSLGFVYNLKEAFITDDRFLAPTPVPYPIGTDVAVVAVPGDPVVYKFDVMAGFVDLSGYLKTADMVSITNQEIDTVVS